MIVGDFATALALVQASGLIASVPERQTGNLHAGMHRFLLPIHARDHDFPALAPAAGCRSRASLVAQSRSGYLRGDRLSGKASSPSLVMDSDNRVHSGASGHTAACPLHAVSSDLT